MSVTLRPGASSPASPRASIWGRELPASLRPRPSHTQRGGAVQCYPAERRQTARRGAHPHTGLNRLLCNVVENDQVARVGQGDPRGFLSCEEPDSVVLKTTIDVGGSVPLRGGQ